MMTQLKGEFRNGQLCAVIPFPEFIELVRKAYGDAKLKRIVQPVAQPHPPVVIVPPLSEEAAMDADLEAYRQAGSPPFGWDYSMTEGE